MALAYLDSCRNYQRYFIDKSTSSSNTRKLNVYYLQNQDILEESRFPSCLNVLVLLEHSH